MTSLSPPGAPRAGAAVASLSRPDWVAVALYLGVAAAYAAARLETSLAWGAWLAAVGMAAALARPQTTLHAAMGVGASLLLAGLVGLPWVFAMNVVIFSQSIGPWAAMAGEYALLTLPPTACIVVARVSLGRKLPVLLWLPPAWALGEWLRSLVLFEQLQAWLATQWQNPPVLHLLAVAGWWPTLLTCLLACASIGEALSRRSFRHALPGAVIAVLLGALPAPGRGPVEALARIGALHLHDSSSLPAIAPPEPLDLVVWPERALNIRPRLAEGPARGTRIAPLLPASPVEHLLGVEGLTPGLGARNALALVQADGKLVQTRAKRGLMPFVERRRWGIGEHVFAPGKLPPVLTIRGEPVGAIICSEVFDRTLIAQVRAHGARVLLVAARDGFLQSDRGRRLALGLQVLRSVEFGLPSMRASLEGWAAFVAADGTLLAESDKKKPGLLTWSAQAGARDYDLWGRPLHAHAPAPYTPDVEVLYSKNSPNLRTHCPAGRCSWQAIEDFRCTGQRRDVVILSGHATLTRWLGHSADDVAAAVRCLRPRLIVVDTCYGASTPLLSALAAQSDAIVVASARIVPSDGLHYGADFFEAKDPSLRAAAVTDPYGGPLLRWSLDAAELAQLTTLASNMGPADLSAALVRRNPACIQLELPQAGPVLVPVDWRRVGRAPRPRPRALERTDG